MELSANVASKLANCGEVRMHASQRANHRIRTFCLRLNKTPRVELGVNAASKLANCGEVHINAASKLANCGEVQTHALQRANHRIRTFSLRPNKTPRVELSVNAASKLANWGEVHKHASQRANHR